MKVNTFYDKFHVVYLNWYNGYLLMKFTDSIQYKIRKRRK